LPEASNLSELDNHRFRISAGRTLKRPLVVIILFGRSIFERNISKPHFALLLVQILANWSQPQSGAQYSCLRDSLDQSQKFEGTCSNSVRSWNIL